MLEVKEELKKFLEEHKHLIEKNSFYPLYYCFNDSRYADNVSNSELTEVLLEAGIDFLRYMDTITKYQFAFMPKEKNNEMLVIPNNIRGIGEYAFMDCDRFSKIYIPDSIIYIGEQAFYNCGADIYYEGDRDNFLEIAKMATLDPNRLK